MDLTSIVFLLFSLLIRWIVSLHSYSGFNKPPMFGDYEAQRHWMEITFNLPVDQWYTNSSQNDLLYWGLDYPPLTAYHSFFMGKIANMINSSWVELFKSRGHESYDHKIFMRSTVLISDCFIYLSAVFIYWTRIQSKSNRASSYLLCSLLYPGLILIDYGHFQYNCVSLGLFIWTIIFLHLNLDVMATIFFCLALNYKQIALYYSLPIFFHLLKKCFTQKSSVMGGFHFLKLGSSVIATFGSLWFPYMISVDPVLQVIRRIFPLNRGIYEDKVANFWYCLSVIFKVKQFFNENQLALLSALLTLVFSLPSCYIILRHNSMKNLKYALFTVSMSFFMFSFQVHEKTILFPNIALFLISDLHSLETFWFSIISTLSLQSLLIKDQLMIPYFCLIIIYLVICHNTNNHTLKNFWFMASFFGTLVLSVGALIIPSPSRYPHLHELLNCLYSFSHFICFYGIILYRQITNYKNERSNVDTEFTRIRKKIKQK